MNIDLHWRLEPEHRPPGDLQAGFQAELGDPLWLLGRQWQMGEQQGENASTPLLVEMKVSETSIEPPADRFGQDPKVIPAEAIIEGNDDDLWPLGRRIAVGLQAVSQGLVDPVSEETDPALLLAGLPDPYRGLNAKVYDGRALARDPALDLGAIIDPQPARDDHWLTDQLCFQTSFSCGNTILAAPRHDGGEVDWWTVDAARALTETGAATSHSARPNRFQYPGSPAPRFWQIEDRKVDIGGFPPDRSHFATLLLIELISSHSDDWFTFPCLTRTGHVLRLEDVRVTDSFGETWPGPAKAWEPLPPDEWSFFKLSGLDPPPVTGKTQAHSLAIWPTAVSPLAGPAVEDVVLGVDEDANLLWAVEQRVDGAEMVQPPPIPDRRDSDSEYYYRPTTQVPHHWHPYEISAVTDPSLADRRRFVQGRFAELRPDGASDPRPAPAGQFLSSPAGIHEIEPASVPTTGLRLEQRFILARGTDGRPVLWLQRQRLPLLGPPNHVLRFDVADPAPPPASPRAVEQLAIPIGSAPPEPGDPLIGMVNPDWELETPEPSPMREALGDPPMDTATSIGLLPDVAEAPDVADSLVILAQALLNAAGATSNDGLPLLPDGMFGPRTGEAVLAFQSARSLPQTGTIDQPSWAALLPLASAAVLLPGQPRPIGPPIARAQQALNRAGMRPMLEVSGVLDEPTEDSLRSFQGGRFLPVTGGLDPGTWLALALAEAEAAPIGLIALNFKYDLALHKAGGPVAELIDVQPLQQLPPAMANLDEIVGNAHWVEIWNETGEVIHRQVEHDMLSLRRESFGEAIPSSPLVEAPSGIFRLVIPRLAGAATLALFGPPFDLTREHDPPGLLMSLDLTGL